jgi:alanyl-tRNA synthetase
MTADLAAGAHKVGEASLVVGSIPETDPDGLRQVALGVREQVEGPVVVIVGALSDGKGALVAAVSKELTSRGVSAGDLIAPSAARLGGGGSRDPELAQAGGPAGALLQEALDLAKEHAEMALTAL